MTTLQDILKKNIEDYKKAKLIETILLEHGHRCFVEVDSRYLRIEEMDNHYTLSKEKLYEILELENIEVAKLITEMGRYNIFYIPISD
ncbi:hypothetical protein [Methanobrevibacter sp.]|uniref:hypothetical protein n=1 Tax=Methanobrevibacter sp. TaxID=66852 RepID=UPI00388DC012